jgi:hypothetical protein
MTALVGGGGYFGMNYYKDSKTGGKRRNDEDSGSIFDFARNLVRYVRS